MLIKNLPRPIKELVFKRQIEQGNEPNEELLLSDTLPFKNFTWTITPDGYTFWQEIKKGNYKPFFEKYGGVILCTSVEQGAKIIEYFKSLGVDTKHYRGYGLRVYYGVVNNSFGYFSSSYVKENNIPIFTIDELGVQTSQECGWQGENTKHVEVVQGEKNTTVTFSLPTQPQQPELPEINFEGIEMEVSDNKLNWQKAIVFAKINGKFYVVGRGLFKHARPIQQKAKVTKEQIAEAFNTTVELLEIEP